MQITPYIELLLVAGSVYIKALVEFISWIFILFCSKFQKRKRLRLINGIFANFFLMLWNKVHGLYLQFLCIWKWFIIVLSRCIMTSIRFSRKLHKHLYIVYQHDSFYIYIWIITCSVNLYSRVVWKVLLDFPPIFVW